jgi:hypothetical protein
MNKQIGGAIEKFSKRKEFLHLSRSKETRGVCRRYKKKIRK